jgi:hypothetical protein
LTLIIPYFKLLIQKIVDESYTKIERENCEPRKLLVQFLFVVFHRPPKLKNSMALEIG